MNVRFLAAAITTVGAIPAFLLSQVIWPNPPGMPAPPATLLPFLLVPAIFEALAFGMGIAFLVLGFRLLSRAHQPAALTLAAYISIAWSLLSWWPHVNFHRAIGSDLVALVKVDWTFHMTLIVAAAVIAYFFLRVVGEEVGDRVSAAGYTRRKVANQSDL